MIDIEDLGIHTLLYRVPKSRNTTDLIEWLREGRKVTPELSLLIADVLAGKIKAKPKPKKRMTVLASCAHPLKFAVTEYFPEILNNPGKIEDWNITSEELVRSGYKGIPETKGEISDAAKHLTAHLFRFTLAQLDELIYPRKIREKSR